MDWAADEEDIVVIVFVGVCWFGLVCFVWFVFLFRLPSENIKSINQPINQSINHKCSPRNTVARGQADDRENVLYTVVLVNKQHKVRWNVWYIYIYIMSVVVFVVVACCCRAMLSLVLSARDLSRFSLVPRASSHYYSNEFSNFSVEGQTEEVTAVLVTKTSRVPDNNAKPEINRLFGRHDNTR